MRKLALAILLLSIGCSNQNETETAAAPPDSGATPSAAMGWQVPAGWTKEAPSSAMRHAQFRLPKADGDPEDASVVIFYFRGEGGGIRANINRWISQFKDAGDSRSESKQEANGLKQTIVDVSGTYLFQPRPMAPATVEKPGFRMFAAVIETQAGPWFVKFVGPKETVKRWESSFQAFLQSFKQS